jgi:hypothetical protein
MPVKLTLELDLEFYAILRKICDVNNQSIEEALIEGLVDLLSYTNPALLRSLSSGSDQVRGRHKCFSKR